MVWSSSRPRPGRAAPPASLQQRLLERVGVLVLVDREPAVLAAELLGHVLAGLEPLQHADQHVLEVDPPGPLLGPLVAPEHPGEQVAGDRRGPAHGLGGLVAGVGRGGGLGPLQLVGQVLDGGELVAGEAALERGQQRRLGVQHLGQPAVGQPRPEVAQLPEGGGVERLAWTPGNPRAASRSRISLAALSVKVTTSTCPDARPRWRSRRRPAARSPGLARPAPARMHNGPAVVETASRCAGFRSWVRNLGCTAARAQVEPPTVPASPSTAGGAGRVGGRPRCAWRPGPPCRARPGDGARQDPTSVVRPSRSSSALRPRRRPGRARPPRSRRRSSSRRPGSQATTSLGMVSVRSTTSR